MVFGANLNPPETMTAHLPFGIGYPHAIAVRRCSLSYNLSYYLDSVHRISLRLFFKFPDTEDFNPAHSFRVQPETAMRCDLRDPLSVTEGA